MSLISKNDWPKDGLGISASQTALRELSSEMDLCSDEDELDALWLSYGPVLALSWEHNADWYVSLDIMYRKRKTELKTEGKYDDFTYERLW